jgi:GntR family transcriptional regulator
VPATRSAVDRATGGYRGPRGPGGSLVQSVAGPGRAGAPLPFGSGLLPRYAQLADLLRARIERGDWPIGARVPTLAQLMADFALARVTVRQAIGLLAREGLVRAYRGRGTFVTGRPPLPRALRLRTSLRELADVYRHDRPELTLIEERESQPALDPAEGRPAPRYWFARRVHARDGQAYCVISIHLDRRVFDRAPRRFRRETVIPVLLELGADIRRARQTLTIEAADLEIAGHLGIAAGAPVARVRRICHGPADLVLYLADVTYRADFVRFEMDLLP